MKNIILIEVEIAEQKPGWKNRVQGYNILKEEKRMLREIYHGENQSMNEMRNFVEKEINKYLDIDVDKVINDDQSKLFHILIKIWRLEC